MFHKYRTSSCMRYVQPAVTSVKGYYQSAASVWSPRNEVNARMATADHDRQGRAAHRQYKLRTE